MWVIGHCGKGEGTQALLKPAVLCKKAELCENETNERDASPDKESVLMLFINFEDTLHLTAIRTSLTLLGLVSQSSLSD